MDTNKLRCRQCNRTAGWFAHDYVLIMSAWQYLNGKDLDLFEEPGRLGAA